MPIIKSAKKRMKQNAKCRQRNFRVRARIHEAVRELNDFAKDGAKKKAATSLSKVYKVIDTAVKKGILHKNTANRRKSSLSKVVANIDEKATKAAPAAKVEKPTPKVEKKEEKTEA